jgi:arsenate reductase
MTMTLYGIKNCDTVKKARAWLDAAGATYVFHDFKVDGVTSAQARAWCEEFGWEKVLNRAGTTFRQLPEAAKRDLDASRAIVLMQAQPTMIKRPILDLGSRRLLGFQAEAYRAAIP